MLKKRLIFTLLFNKGNFMLSRNFRLQKVGNANWLKNSYNFEHIAFSIDELILLDVTRNDRDIILFSEAIRSIVDTCFIPVSAGGGIRSEEDAIILMNSGADKLVINTVMVENCSLVSSLVSQYGSQCIIASVDYKVINDKFEVYINNGTRLIEYQLGEYLLYLESLEVGEIYLNSMEQDGTGQGYHIDYLKEIIDKINVPVILAGGAGKYQHFIEAVNNLKIDAVATANLFNFIGEGFPNARDKMINADIDLAIWNRNDEKLLEGYFSKK
jgi:imidazole glycerol-phosphate synthase subunit HisF